MVLADTVEMMTSEDYNERFKAEYYQLKIRAEGLERMLEKYKAGTLEFKPSCPYDLLHRQLKNMKLYMWDLEERAGIEGIKLN
jgi:hypothetical protein